MGLLDDQISRKAGLITHNNHKAEVEIVLTMKKFQVLSLITFRGYSFPQTIQNSIRVLGAKTYKSYSTSQN